MPRPPLPLGAWGRINTTRVEAGQYRSRARFRDFDGVTRLVEASGPSRGKAEAELLDRLRNRARPSAEDITGSTTLGAVADMWILDLQDSDRAAGTKETYADLVRRHLRPALGQVRIQELSVGLLDRHLQAVRGRSGDTTAKMLRTVLTAVVDLAVRHDALQANPARQTKPIAPKAKHVVALSVEDATSLRRALRGDRAAVRAELPDLVDLMLATGCRINEALAVTWSQVDLKSDVPTVSITATVTRMRGIGLVLQSHPKTDASKRSLKLRAFAVDMLLRRSVEQQPNPHDVVFPSSTGTLRDSRNVSRQWRDFQERDKRWKAVTSHTFRKTVATVLSREFDALTASAQLGHASSKVTERYYIARTHEGPDARASLAAFAERGDSDG